MIRYLKRKELNEQKYNACIEKSIQSNVYAYSWYLDIVAENWAVLILNDYEAVMPLPFKQKYFIKYVYPPFWMLHLGVFSLTKRSSSDDFLEVLFKKFRFSELRMNPKNNFHKFSSVLVEKQMQFLSLKEEYDVIYSGYNRNRKRELQTAKNEGLIEKWNDHPENLIQLFKNNVAQKVKNIVEQDLSVLLKLIKVSVEKGVGEVLSIYDKNNNLVASAFFLKNKNAVDVLVCSTDFKNRKNGANTFFNDRAIFKYRKDFEIYNFGGSSIKPIAKHYKSYGANTETYNLIVYNNLPFLFRIFKR